MDDDMDLYDPLKTAGSLSLEEMIENDIRSSVDDDLVFDDELDASTTVRRCFDSFELEAPSKFVMFDDDDDEEAEKINHHHFTWFNNGTNNHNGHLDFDQAYVFVNPSSVLPPLEMSMAVVAHEADVTKRETKDEDSLIMVKPALVEMDDAIACVKQIKNNHQRENNNHHHRKNNSNVRRIGKVSQVGRLVAPHNRDLNLFKDRSTSIKLQQHNSKKAPNNSQTITNNCLFNGGGKWTKVNETESSEESSSSSTSSPTASDGDSDVDTIPKSMFSAANSHGSNRAKTKVCTDRTAKGGSVQRQSNSGRSAQIAKSNGESTEHAQLDARNFPKPAYSYSCLIAIALKNSETGSLPVSEIYSFMTETFPYFKTAPSGWKNSVRHNLSLNKSFEKIDRGGLSTNNQKKGCLWGLNPEKADRMDEELLKWSRKDPMAIKNSMARPETLELLEKGCLKLDSDWTRLNCRKKTVEQQLKADVSDVPINVKIADQPTVADYIDLESSSDSDVSSHDLEDDDDISDVADEKMDFDASLLVSDLPIAIRYISDGRQIVEKSS